MNDVLNPPPQKRTDPIDVEIDAMQACYRAVRHLDSPSRERVLAYVEERCTAEDDKKRS